jgi:hypothetical protein
MCSCALFALLVVMPLAACGSSADAAHNAPVESGPVDAAVAPPPPTPVKGEFRLVDAATGKGFAGGTLTLGEAATPTDELGMASLLVPPGAFDVTLKGPGIATYTLAGAAGTSAFSFVSYVSSRRLTAQVASLLDTKVDPALGILVVGVDDALLRPAVGARVAITAKSDAPFVFDGSAPKRGDTVTKGASFVSFLNVSPGQVHVTVTPPPGTTCHVAPGPGLRDDFVVAADEVTVVAYLCE